MTDTAVILVGGYGSRLGKITKKIPKPLIRIQNKKFLEWIIINLSKYNIKKIYLLCSYKKNLFFKFFHNKNFYNLNIQCIDEGSPKGTGGALLKVKNRIKKNFLLLNGDTYFDINLNKIFNLKNKIGNIALVQNKNHKYNKKLSKINIKKNSLIFFSKKKSNIMNAGIYYFSKKIFRYLNKKSSLEDEVIPKLVKEKKLIGSVFYDNFIDIGTPKNLERSKNLNFFKHKAIFLDRDGVINKEIKNSYVLNKNQFTFNTGAKKAISYLNKKKYLIIIVTNQACIGKKLITEIELQKIHDYMKQQIFRFSGGYINDIFYAPYYKYSKEKKYRLNYNLRKPNDGMFKLAKKKWNIELSQSIMIGNQVTDQIASKKAKIKYFMYKGRNLFNFIKKIIK